MTPNETNDPLFTPSNDPTPIVQEGTDFVSQLIGEGKKYKDAQALAKAVLDKDAFIEQLKSENFQMRSSLRGEQKIDEFLDKLNKSPSPSTVVASTPVTNQSENTDQTNQTKALSQEEIIKILEQRDNAKQAEMNLRLAVDQVKKVYGANYTQVMKTKAEELNMSPESLTNLAKNQPAAFLKLVEADKLPQTQGNLPKSSVNTSAMNNSNSGQKTQKYYRDLRKQVGDAVYFSPKIQNELMKSALELGNAFFD